METYKREFIEFMVRSDVLTFGDFVTKSGRKTPFFINTGRYRTGAQLAQLGRYYAEALRGTLGDGFDVLFGPAYKGIPLVTAAALTLSERYGKDVAFCFNRKEAKDHGEGGVLIGHTPKDGERVVIVEDVTTAGTSIRETVPLLRAAAPAVKLAGLVVSVDRQERGTGTKTALAEVAETYQMRTFAIVTLDEVVEHLSQTPVDGKLRIDAAMQERIAAYRQQYGA
jgi:orotate phosphoribosyltransferase